MKYEVRRYYSSFVTYEIEADSEDEAFEKTKKLEVDMTELYNNSLEWREADEIYQLEEANWEE